MPLRRSVRIAAATAGTALLALTAAGCGGGGDPADLTVFAAASLHQVFEELAADYEAAHPGATVTINLAGSNALAEQVLSGARADVLATADTVTMAKVAEAGLTAGDPEVFTANDLVVVTPADDPADVSALADLSDPGLRLVVCAPKVPCGAATTRLAAQAGLDLDPVSEEDAVTDVLAKVLTGQADAGLVYRTDAYSAGDQVRMITPPEGVEVVNDYPIATVAEARNPGGAAEFVALVRSERGREVLAEAGFR